MIPSGPHSSTMGTGERSSMPAVVFRLCGHPEIGPKPVSDQSRRRMSAPISPPPKGKLLLFPELAMRAWNLDQSEFLYRGDLWHTREQPYLLTVHPGSFASFRFPDSHGRTTPNHGHQRPARHVGGSATSEPSPM